VRSCLTVAIEVGHFNLEQGEESTALLPFTSGSASYLCVAAVTLEDEDTEASKGRVFVLTMSNASHVSMSVVASQDVKGCPYALTSVNSMIVAAVNSAVMTQPIHCINNLSFSCRSLSST